MLKICSFNILIYLFCNIVTAQLGVSIDIKKKNLTKFLYDYYQKDSLKQKAATFLVSHINLHKSKSYKWLQNNEKIIPYNELNYPTIDEAIVAFKKLRDSIKLQPQTYEVNDIDAVTAELLIKNIDVAFDSWRKNPWSKHYDFDTFCEYILPYRSIVEPLENWREEYNELMQNAATKTETISSPTAVTISVLESLRNFRFLESRPDPIPYLSPKQLLFRRAGSCNDLANLAVLACRSVGLAVTFDFTPFYGASSNKHFWNTIRTEGGEHIPFNGVSSDNPEGLPYKYKPTHKRLAKVYRKTYSGQVNALASITNNVNIPDGFLNDKNILDVTASYVPTGSLKIEHNLANKNKIAFINVFNLNNWETVGWARKSQSSYLFDNLGTNIVYLPSFFDSKYRKMKFADYPVLLETNKKQTVLKPNYNRTFSFDIKRDIKLKGQTKDFNSFEVFDNEIFSLIVWDKGWVKVEDVVAKNNAIHFTKIPDNGLFILICKKSNGYERIFRINTNTKQIEWY